jgi:putative ABC transport system permease protein
MTLDRWWRDLRLAWRGLSSARGLSVAAVLTLAVAIASTTLVFAVIHGVLLRPLPVDDPDRLVVAWKALPAAGHAHWPFRAAEVDVIRRESQVFERVAAVSYYGAGREAVVEGGSAGYVNTTLVDGGFFDVLGVEPLLGRALAQSDDRDGAEPVLVISHALWVRRYGGDPRVLGRRLALQERTFTIVGVMPADVEYPRGAEAWRPLASVPADSTFGEAARRDVDMLARLRPRATIEAAHDELRRLLPRLQAEIEAGTPRDLVPVVHAYEDVVIGDVRPALAVLVGAVALVLLIASANVANLLLARAEDRRADLAIRRTLGATAGGLVRQVLAESLLLAFAAGALGTLAAAWSLPVLLASLPYALPRGESIRIDAGVLLFTTMLALVTAALAGLAPALSSARTDPVTQLRAAGRGSTRGTGRRGPRALVVAQVALAVAVVVGAGLLTRSVRHLQSLDIGLAADRLVFVELAMPDSEYGGGERRQQFFERVMADLHTVPGVAAVTPVHVLPFAGTGGWDLPTFAADGQPAERAAANPVLNIESVHESYFRTLEVEIVRGRPFVQTDTQAAPLVAVVSEDVAARTWPGQDPIGRRLKFGRVDSDEPWRTVVGVARPTRYRELARPRPTLYLPAEQFIAAPHALVVRATSSTIPVAELTRARVRAVDPGVQVMRVAPFDELLQEPLAKPRFNALATGTFAIVALLLAALGLHAVVARDVRRRFRELGIRIALGATAADVHRLVLGDGMRLVLPGIACGLAVAAGGTRLLTGLLVGVHPLDPASLVGAVLLLAAGCLVAALVPAWRASRLDPAITLRAE